MKSDSEGRTGETEEKRRLSRLINKALLVPQAAKSTRELGEVELIDPASMEKVGVVSIVDGWPRLSNLVPKLQDLEKGLSEFLTEDGNVIGHVGASYCVFEVEYSPGEDGYWPSLRTAIGDYLFRDPKTGQLF